jgi:transcriptional regulator
VSQTALAYRDALNYTSQVAAPVAYFVEQNPEFSDLVEPIFVRLDRDIIKVVSSEIRAIVVSALAS